MIESQAITKCISVFSDIPVSLNMDVSLLHKGGVNHQQGVAILPCEGVTYMPSETENTEIHLVYARPSITSGSK